MTQIDRNAYAQMYGPTTGDRIRLGDTELWVRVEKDFTIYGEEVKFGGGKVIRDGMGQSQRGDAESMDTIITNALILDMPRSFPFQFGENSLEKHLLEAKKYGVETQVINIDGLSFDLDDIDDWNYLIATNKSLLNKLD